jgi:glycosyltransferase involved in cell wall biosynthesis
MPRTSRPAGHSAATRFLFVGRLVELKRPVELARAFVRAMPSMAGATLTFIGDGPLRGVLSEIAASTDGRIRVLERAEGAALATRFLDADVLVLPSVREVWGLVVNEALAAGLFVVATDQVASAVDLLDQGSGLIVPADLPARLEDALRAADRVGQSDTERAARTARVMKCTGSSFAADLHQAIELALNS